mmetsp:Transcript_37725/g.118096  ORF Transcript_37725/g.118096 Transcript_37725/m.118096 type:complete len:333 (-) Transcript_37725:1074-2072(-)
MQYVEQYEQRLERVRKLQYDDGEGLFATQYTTLHKAAGTNDVSGVIYFIMERGVDVNERDALGNTPLHHAARTGSLLALEKLLEHDAKPMLANQFGQSVSHMAAINGRAKVLKMLYDKGSNVMNPDSNGASPAHYAAVADDVEVLRTLYYCQDFPLGPETLSVVNNFDITPAHVAAQYDSCDALRYLASVGVNVVDCVDKDGDTPAHFAAKNNNFDCLKMLVNMGADIEDIENSEGDSARDLINDEERYSRTITEIQPDWRRNSLWRIPRKGSGIGEPDALPDLDVGPRRLSDQLDNSLDNLQKQFADLDGVEDLDRSYGSGSEHDDGSTPF